MITCILCWSSTSPAVNMLRRGRCEVVKFGSCLGPVAGSSDVALPLFCSLFSGCGHRVHVVLPRALSAWLSTSCMKRYYCTPALDPRHTLLRLTPLPPKHPHGITVPSMCGWHAVQGYKDTCLNRVCLAKYAILCCAVLLWCFFARQGAGKAEPTVLALGVDGGFRTDEQKYDIVKTHRLVVFKGGSTEGFSVAYPDGVTARALLLPCCLCSDWVVLGASWCC